MLYALGVVIGLVVGWFIFKLRFRNGVLKMTETDDKDVYTLFIDDMDDYPKMNLKLFRWYDGIALKPYQAFQNYLSVIKK